jgi:hypothetical protein
MPIETADLERAGTIGGSTTHKRGRVAAESLGSVTAWLLRCCDVEHRYQRQPPRHRPSV